jgi:hypothetical protein
METSGSAATLERQGRPGEVIMLERESMVLELEAARDVISRAGSQILAWNSRISSPPRTRLQRIM